MKRSLSLSGIPVSPGIAVGRAAVWLVRADSSPRRDLDSEEVPAELERLRLAVESAIREIGEMAGQVEERLGKEYAAIFQAHALFLRDPSFLGPIGRRSRSRG
jgi:phosphotransferase system enzyme I (PtsI)